MESPESKPIRQQALTNYETLSEGRKEVMLFLFQTMAEQTATLGAASQKHIAICNMGGIAALLAFAGTKGLDTAGLMVYAFYAFSVGLILVSISMGCSYHMTASLFGKMLDDLMQPAPESSQSTENESKSSANATCFEKLCAGLHAFAVEAATPLAWLSLAAFCIGMFCGGLALDHLPSPKT